ncbi:hypothetical protein [Mycobacterium timonense]|uniref:Condensation domain-containing protein n=1 Tax=Mycobacterium timonense TaxID=701043 RepID=A0A7I9ZF27_9MYCO|nr:hypothetical protein [Mycobacterium timonense]GFG99402.1 hypothetical protein MTIM_52810 [Mycobacterium timonense]
MARDISEAYRARRQAQALRLAPLPVQYADYTLWQRDWLGIESDPDSVIAGQLAYWRQELADLPEVASLPADGRAPVPTYRGDAVDMHLDARLWAGISARRTTRPPRWCCRRPWRWCCTGRGRRGYRDGHPDRRADGCGAR